MMMWYGGDVWAWCTLILNVLAVVVILGVIIAAIILAVRSAERSGRSSTGDSGSAQAPEVSAARGVRGEMGDDDIYRRPM
jgi:uncharacterized membrane protein